MAKCADWLRLNALTGTKSRKSVESYVKGWLPKPLNHPYTVAYAADFRVPSDFGCPGAILITNNHGMEFHLMDIVVHGFKQGHVFFPADTWIHSQNNNPDSRIIFTNKVWMTVLIVFVIRLLIAAWLVYLRGEPIFLNRRIYRHKHLLALEIYDSKTCAAFEAMGKERGKCMREYLIMPLIMIWVIRIKERI